MITDLHISNYALIDSIEISFGEGLNIITGETGAGKSIILGALGLLLGARADNRVIRRPEEKSVVEATFTIPENYPRIRQSLAEADIEWPEGSTTITLRRELTSNGRNRVFINDAMTTLGSLQNVATQLIDIHSQHQNALLTDHAFQLRLLDSMAGNGETSKRFSEAYTSYRHALRRYRQERTQLDQAREEEEYLRFQFAQLADASLQSGEIEQLEAEQRMLENAAAVSETLLNLRRWLSDEGSGAVFALEQARTQASKLTGMLADEKSAELEQRLESLGIELDDISAAYNNYAGTAVDDPSRLVQVEERLNLLYTLLRRHNADTIEALIDRRDKMGARLRALDLGEETLKELEVEAKRAKKVALQVAAELTERRRSQAEKLSVELADRARPLGMENLKVAIEVAQTPLGPTGCDSVGFLFAFNKNQNPTTVAASASGGEISRLMLAVKSLAAEALQMPAIVFDEIDTGVSGAIAARMGTLMQSISKRIQVIAITHLPQVAALGDTHFRVYKHDTDSSTLTSVDKLSAEQRVEELAKMLSGSAVDQAAIANARALLNL